MAIVLTSIPNSAAADHHVYEPQAPLHPILTISYNEDVRALLVKSLHEQCVVPATCSSFVEAESLAVSELYSGILVDLPSIVKAKGEEKIVATSLGNIFPILRVKVIGTMLVPIVLSGGAAQAKSLNDFLTKVCTGFAPRRLRTHKRHLLHTPALVSHKNCEYQTFTFDLSWGGTFLVNNRTDRYAVGDDVMVTLPELGLAIAGVICRVQPWGQHKIMPGIGVRWHLPLEGGVERQLLHVLKARRDHDPDRFVG